MPEGMKEPTATPMEGVEETSKPTSKSATVEDDTPEPARKQPSKPTPAPAKAEPAAPEPSADEEEKTKAMASKARGAEAYKAREFDAAIQAFNEAWETWPKDVTFLTNLAGKSFLARAEMRC
jgi:stress-induced-phosphoprotein 1